MSNQTFDQNVPASFGCRSLRTSRIHFSAIQKDVMAIDGCADPANLMHATRTTDQERKHLMDNVDSMSNLEKVRAMEQLWDALTRGNEFPDAPQWHRDKLQRRTTRIQEDQVDYLSLDQLKERGPGKLNR